MDYIICKQCNKEVRKFYTWESKKTYKYMCDNCNIIIAVTNGEVTEENIQSPDAEVVNGVKELISNIRGK